MYCNPSSSLLTSQTREFLLLSGAVGNLIDRAQFGFVVDFIDVHVNGYYWPVFNLADSFIFLGVLLLLFERKSTA